MISRRIPRGGSHCLRWSLSKAYLARSPVDHKQGLRALLPLEFACPDAQGVLISTYVQLQLLYTRSVDPSLVQSRYEIRGQYH